MLRCNQAVELMGRDSGDPLPLRDRISLRMHLFVCRHCRAYRRGLDRMRDLVRMRSHSDEAVDPRQIDDMVERIRAEVSPGRSV